MTLVTDAASSGLPRSIGCEDLDAAVATLAAEFDPAGGGFGDTPEIAPSMVWEFLLRHGSNDALRMVDHALDLMIRGSVHDQLGGGFARCDREGARVVARFQKTLFDNALLIRVCADRRTPPSLWAGEQAAEFLLRELRTVEGGFASTLGGDSEEDRLFYVWTPAQLVDVLGEDDGVWAAALFSVTPDGAAGRGTSVLLLREDSDDMERWLGVRDRLFRARESRVRPVRDDEVVAAWNGLAISALARLGLWLEEARYVDAAVGAAELLLRVHLVDGRLRRTSRAGVVGARAGVLKDYGCVASGWLELFQATGDLRWLRSATALIDVALDRFSAEDGGFYDDVITEPMTERPRDPTDGAAPSGLSSIVHALVVAAAITGEPRYRAAAEAAVLSAREVVVRSPGSVGWLLAAVAAMLDGPDAIAIVGPPGARRESLANLARQRPTAVVLVDDGPCDEVPLLAGRDAIDGKPAAYVCRNQVCAAPVTEVADLAREEHQ